MASPEQRIYQNSPKAPTPGELKRTIELLVKTHGNGWFLTVSSDRNKLDGAHNTQIQFNSHLNERGGGGSVGLSVLSRVKPTFEIGKSPDLHYEMIADFEIYSDRKNKKVNTRNNHTGQRLTPGQRRAVKQLALVSWELGAEKNPTPSKQ